MKKQLLLIALLFTTVHTAHAQIQSGTVLTTSAKPVAIYSADSASLIRVGPYDIAVLVNVTMEGYQPKESTLSFLALDGKLSCLIAADQKIWSRGSIGLSKNTPITISVPLNKFTFDAQNVGRLQMTLTTRSDNKTATIIVQKGADGEWDDGTATIELSN